MVDIEKLAETLLNVELTATQVDIVKSILNPNEKRIVISAFTRFGKTYSVAVGILLYIWLKEDKSVTIIAPKYEQSKILRDYVAEFLVGSPYLEKLLPLDVDRKAEKLEKEVSRKRLTFTNGCELKVLSAQGTAERLMGHGADLLVCAPHDEKIYTNKGVMKIGEVVENKVDCEVLSYNHEKDEVEFKPIARYFENGEKEILEIVTNKKKLRCTPNHPIFVKGRGYIPAEGLKEGDMVMGYGKDLNIMDTLNKYALHKLRLVWKRILQTTKQNKENKQRLLQQGMPGKRVLQKLFTKTRNYLRQLWKEIQSNTLKTKKRRKTLLLNKMPRKILQRKKQSFLQRKTNFDMSRMWGKNKAHTIDKPEVLLGKVQGQSTFQTNEKRRKPKLEGRNTNRTLLQRFYKGIYKEIKEKIRLHLPTMRGEKELDEGIINSPYRLQQEKLKPRQSRGFMSILPWKNRVQSREMEEEIVKEIRKGDSEKVYNLEVEGNNNYFLSGVLTHNCDESCLIDFDVYRSKISRMLGDSADSKLVEIGNPWSRDNQMWEHWTDENFKQIHIPWETGVEENRVTEEFVEEQEELLTPMEFKVLYEAEFPEEPEDALFKWSWVQDAVKKDLTLSGALTFGLDVAESGLDHNVLTVAEKQGNRYKVLDIYSWDKDDTMATVGEALNRIKSYKDSYELQRVNIDATGLGKPICDRVKERLDADVNAVKVGKKPTREKDRFRKRKAQFYVRLRGLFEDGQISIPRDNNLLNDLRKMKYERTSSERLKIVDPEDKSPDYSDSLMLCCCPDTSTSIDVMPDISGVT